MKVVILQGSPRHGNTYAMAQVFEEAAKGAGHDVEMLEVGKMKINGCIACMGCKKNDEHKCVQNDDMQQVYPKLLEADMVVIASPIYCWGFTGQMQSVITRFFAKSPLPVKKWALLLSSGSPNMYDAPVFTVTNMMKRYNSELVGVITAHGDENGSPEKTEEIRKFAAAI